MPETTLEKQERYVDDLADPDDYWLSITDAARATRRQDISIRRWISKGLLPVRRQHVGLNQRTRQVRASDLSKLTPIVDPTAGITSERGQVDLVSIPVQQAAIRAAHEELLRQVADLRLHVEHRFTAMQTVFAEQITQHHRDIDTLRTSFTTTLAEVERSVEVQHRQHAALAELINDNQCQLVQLRSQTAEQVTSIGGTLTELREALHGQQIAMSSQLDQEREQRRLEIAAMATALREALSHHREALDTILVERQHEVEQLRQALQEHEDREAQALQAHREQIETLLEQRSRQVDEARHRLNKEVAAALSGFTQQVEETRVQLRNLDTSIEVAKMAVLGLQHRADKQDEQMASLRAQLVEAQQERANLAQQVTELATQVLHLQQEPRRSPRRVSRSKEK
jgi:hypothetical protein